MFWLACGILLAVYYFLLVRPVEYWTSLGIPQPDAWKIWLTATAEAYQKLSLQAAVHRIYRTYSGERYFGGYRFFKPILYIKDLDLIQSIWRKDFDHFTDQPTMRYSFSIRSLFGVKENTWNRAKSTISSSLNEETLTAMFVPMAKRAETFVKQFEAKNIRTLPVEIKDAFGRITTDMCACFLLGITNDLGKDQNNELFTKIKDSANFRDWKSMVKISFAKHFPRLAQVFGIILFNEELMAFLRKLIQDKRKTGDFENGLLKTRLELNKDDINMNVNIVEQPKLHIQGINGAQKVQFTDEELAALIATMLVINYEKMSTFMYLFAYELTINPYAQSELYKEVTQSFENCGGSLTYEALSNMTYLDAVLTETLRKWPIIFTMKSICSKPYTIPPIRKGETPVHLKPGDAVELPIYCIHRDTDFHPDPLYFKPERLCNTRASAPFGIGPRQCVAAKLALLEVKIVFVHLLRVFHLTGFKESNFAIEFARSDFHLDIKDDMCLGFRLRSAKFEGIR